MIGRMIRTVFLLYACAACAYAQDLPPAQPPAADSDPALTHRPASTPAAIDKPLPVETIPLIVPKGTPVQVILDTEVRVRKVGQAIHGRIAEPVYAFDKVVLPLGTEVTGEIRELESVSGGKRTLDALDAEFTPPRKVQVEFNELITADGRHIPIRSTVTPGSGEEIRFVTAADDKKKGVKDAAADKAKQAKEEAKREWDAAVKQVNEPGKAHRLERAAVAQLPIHPQYIDAGTVYFAELQEPLDFGSEPMTPEIARAIKTPAPPGSFLRARLMTAVNSATTLKGDEVEAILSQPLFDGTRLILPQGSRLKGTVVQVQPARYLSRDGRLRMVFHELILPDGIEQKVDAILEGIQAGKDQNLRMDSEGGAEATPPKTRFLATTVAVGLGAISFLGDTFGDIGPRVAGGAGGYKLVGIALGAAIRSQGFGMAMGAYGGCRSIYTHFIARGRDVVFPKNTSMVIGIGARTEPPPKPPEDAPAAELRPPA
jgi:hypothetical protein